MSGAKRLRTGRGSGATDSTAQPSPRKLFGRALQRCDADRLARLVLPHLPPHVVEQLVADADRSFLTELPTALQALVFSFSNATDYFALARCGRQLRAVSRCASASLATLVLPNVLRFSASLLDLRPTAVDIALRWSLPMPIARLVELVPTTLARTHTLALGLEGSARGDTDYTPLSRLTALTDLALTVCDSGEAAAAVCAVVGARLATLSIAVSFIEHTELDYSLLGFCTALRSLSLQRAPTSDDDLRALQRDAPTLRALALRWPHISPLPETLEFLTAFSALDALSLDFDHPARPDAPAALPGLSRLRSLDVALTQIPLTAFHDADRWRALTRLAPRSAFAVSDLRHLPPSLIELDIRRGARILDAFFDVIVRHSTTTTAAAPTRAANDSESDAASAPRLPTFLRRLILPSGCSVQADGVLVHDFASLKEHTKGLAFRGGLDVTFAAA